MEHGFIAHSTTPYDELIRVPLIIKFPNSLHRGKVIKNQVRLIDIMPTLLDFLKIKIDSNLEGFSLLNYLDFDAIKNNKIDFPEYAISEIGFYEVNPTVSIRTDEFKYIYFEDRRDEFYDLNLDSKEQNNIIDFKRDEAEKFYKIALDIKEKRKKGVKEILPDENTIKELKSLGYIE
jgi:arylsulfatase A-like enzyme